MKVIIAGSRTIDDYSLVCRVIRESGFDISEVVSGGAQGVDALGEQWASQAGLPVKIFKANWALGKSAGMQRNREMAEYADALIVIHNGSKGSVDMVKKARANKLLVYEKDLRPKQERL